MRTTSSWATALLFLATASVPARGDWQYTKWGMSVDEVVRASENKLRTPTPKERNDLTLTFADHALPRLAPALIGEYHTESFQFILVMYFGGVGHSLSRIVLKLKNHAQTRSVIPALIYLYGPSFENKKDNTGSSLKWIDEKNNNEVIASDLLDQFFDITYTPLPSKKGL